MRRRGKRATYLLTRPMIGLSENFYIDLLNTCKQNENNRIRRSMAKTNHYLGKSLLNSKDKNAAQETEIESYVIGGIKQDVEKGSLKNLNYDWISIFEYRCDNCDTYEIRWDIDSL